MNRTKQTAERRLLHVINRRMVILAAPPFDELNVVGVFQVFLVWAVENLDKDLSVENLALHGAMSRRNFTRVFTAELGTSPAHYIEQLRIEAARQLLEDSRKNLATAAHESSRRQVEFRSRSAVHRCQARMAP